MALEIINKFKLEKATIPTYEHSSFVADVNGSDNVVEYRKTDSNNQQNLQKKGDFYGWSFDICRNGETDSEWTSIIDSLKAFNGLANITFTPDTVDNPTDSLKVYFWSKDDKVNSFPAEKIFCRVNRVHSEGNEP